MPNRLEISFRSDCSRWVRKLLTRTTALAVPRVELFFRLSSLPLDYDVAMSENPYESPTSVQSTEPSSTAPPSSPLKAE